MPDCTNTVRLHRVLRAAPARVPRAFLDPDAMVKWLPAHGFNGRVQAMDARVGGMQVTISLRKVARGTDLAVVEQGSPPASPVESCCPGWQESSALLAHLVGPESS